MSGFAVTYTPRASGILQARLDSLNTAVESGNINVTLGVNSERYDYFLTPAAAIDNLGITTTNTINAKKLEIVDLGDDDTFYGAQQVFATGIAATEAVATIYGNVISTVGIASAIDFTSSATFTKGNFLTQAGTGAYAEIVATQGSTTRCLVVGTGRTGFNLVGQCRTGVSTINSVNVTVVGVPQAINFVGMGNIYQDTSLIYTYPNLEPANTSNPNPFNGAASVVLGVGNSGLGAGNTFYPNSMEGANLLGGAVSIGTVFTFNTGGDVAAATSITSIEGEIEDLRVGMTSFTQTNDIIKPYKIDFAINVWSLTKVNADNATERAGLATAIQILNDPQWGGPY